MQQYIFSYKNKIKPIVKFFKQFQLIWLAAINAFLFYSDTGFFTLRNFNPNIQTTGFEQIE